MNSTTIQFDLTEDARKFAAFVRRTTGGNLERKANRVTVYKRLPYAHFDLKAFWLSVGKVGKAIVIDWYTEGED